MGHGIGCYSRTSVVTGEASAENERASEGTHTWVYKSKRTIVFAARPPRPTQDALQGAAGGPARALIAVILESSVVFVTALG